MPTSLMLPPLFSSQIAPRDHPRYYSSSSSAGGSCLGMQKGAGAEDLGPFKDATHFSRGKDEDYESKSGSDHMEGGSCDEQDQDQPSRKKRYHRHTAKQIQEMEMVFKECPHPDEKQRLELSRELGLEPRQVKFWFQNRRTQLKAQHEKVENSVLRAENDKLRAENITMREALKTACCQNCGGQISLGDLSFIEQQLRLENARLRDELDRITALASNYLARTPNPIVSAPQQVSISPPDLSVRAGSFASSLPSEAISNHGHISEADKPLMAELAIVAMEEFFAVTQADESLWTSQRSRDTMNYDEYTAHYSRGMGPRHVGLKTEATRATGLVMINTASLVEIVMDHTKWTEMFTCIVSKALALQVLSNGTTSGSWNNALQLMYAELQMPSPIVPTRQVYFLRYCKQHSEGLWAIVDVSLDGFREKPLFPVTKCRRRPSGFLVQEMPNGYSKVTVVEHTEYEEREVHPMFRQMVAAGLAFGAQRWLAILQRQCERLSSAMATNLSTRDLGVISSANGGRSMLKLAQRMTDSFCGGISASTSHTWTTLSGTGEEDVRVMTRKSINNPGEPHGIVLSAATSLWLRVAPRRLFDFLRDEHNRSEWDILSNGGVAQEISHISNGQSPGNNVALLKVNAMNTSQNNMLILQESCWDSSGSLVVYAPVDIPAMNLVIQGGDPGYVALLPSGFAILPDGLSSSPSHLDDSVPSRGCLLTVAFQILVSNVPTAKLNLESVTTVNSLISCTVQRIKSALGCEDV